MFEQSTPQSPSLPTTPSDLSSPGVNPSPKRNRKGLAAAVIIIGLFVLGAGGAAAYYFLSQPTPEEVLEDMFSAMGAVTSVAFQASAELTGEADGAERRFSPTVTGAYDWSDRDLQKLWVDVAFTGSLGDVEDAFTASLRAQGEDDTYVRLGSLPTALGSPFPDIINLEAVETVLSNRWISFNKHDIFNTLGLTGETLQKLEEFAPREPSDEEKTAMVAELRQAVMSSVQFTDTLPSEVVDQVATYHYAFTVHAATLKKSLDDFSETYPGALGKKGRTDVLEQMGDVEGEVWIGKQDSLVRRLALRGTVEMGDLLNEEEGLVPSTLALTVNLSDYNVPVNVELPEDATPILDVLQEVMAAAIAAAEGTDEDGDGLRTKKEEEYGTDPTNPDTDGDGYTDGAEVKNGYNPNGEGELPENSSTTFRSDLLNADDILDDEF